MFKRMVCLVVVVSMFGAIANAADIKWTGGGSDNLWSTPANWTSNRVPTAADEVFIDVPAARAPNGPIIQDGINAKILGLLCEVAGEPEMTMTGGTLEISDYIWWGDGQDSHGTFYMSGGTITVSNELELGWGGGTGTWIMTGGEVTCGRLRIPTPTGAAGELFLSGGTFNVGSSGLDMSDVGTIDVGDGTLVLDGDVTATIQGLIDAGQITAYGGGGRVLLDFDLTNPGKTTLAAAWTGVAYKPNPADGDYYADTWANISWLPDEAAASHDVYFGDNCEDVANGTGDAVRGNQVGTNYIVGFPGYPYPDGLVPGTTYCWRIDEIEADGTVHTGDVWSFTIPPRTAYNPSPADGAEFVDLDTELTWTPGHGAKLHTVYFGDNYDDVDNAAGGISQGNTTYRPFFGPLELEKVYYWRVDEFDGADTHRGDIWAFATPGAVGNPNPANGATGVQMNATLSWTPGESATSSEVYLGTDKNAVRSATTASPEYQGSKPLGSESYDPGKLAWKSMYYWRVDGIESLNPASPWKGNVWSFETADYITVDDFESYNDLAEEDPASNRIYLSWIDGFGTTTNGSVVGYAELPLAERGNVHGGGTSMPYSYDNNLKYSEASMTLVYPRDWTEEGVGVLSLWFNGNSSNDPEAMYVVLNGTAVVYHDDPGATQAAVWTRWTIDLQEFASQGVDLTNVNSIGIGFGDKNNVQAGGSGKMLFDDIQLRRPAVTAVVGTLTGLADVTVVDDAIVSLRHAGTEYVVADGDLALGTTTRWYIDPGTGAETVWAEGDPAPPATASGTSTVKDGDVGSNADNFFFSIPGDADNISSIDGIDFQQTVFPFLSDTFFVFERGGNDAGTFQAILADGSLGEPVAFDKSTNGGPYANTGVANGNQNAFGVVFKTNVPVMGVRITASGHDTLSISTIAAP